MLRFFSWLYSILNQAISLVFPFLSQAAELPLKHSPKLRILVIVLLSALFVGSGYLICIWVPEVAKLWTAPAILHPDLWLAALFLFLLLSGWGIYWVLLTLRGGPAYSSYPDIDSAWEEIVEALYRAQISLTDAPVFLVLGNSSAGEDALFKGTKLVCKVAHAARGPSRLRVYASVEPSAIFITCSGLSLLAQAADRLARVPVGPSPDQLSGPGMNAQTIDIRMTLGADAIKNLLATVQKHDLGPGGPGEGEGVHAQLVRNLNAAMKAEGDGGGQRPLYSLVQNAAEIRIIQNRLKHLCGLMIRDRTPECPLNGVVLLLPLAASAPRAAAHAARIVQLDLTSVREATRMHFPTVAMVCDMEKAEGFLEFMARFSAEEREGRLGRSFPWVPTEPPAQWPAVLENFGEWICREYFSYLVYRRFDLKAASVAEEEPVRLNVKLFRLLRQMAEHSTGMAQILREGLIPPEGAPLRFGGLYLAATGEGACQGFVKGVFFDKIAFYDQRRDDNMQNMVSWTDEARKEDQRLKRRTTLGYWVGGLTLALSVSYLVVAILLRLRKS